MRNLFLDAEKNGGLAFRKLMLRTGEGTTHLSFKVQPLGGLYLGVVDNAYESELAREMHSAQDIQQRLLPPGKGGSVPYSFLYLPCREIGGDLPDVYEAEGETMGLLADVSGKGISAGMLSAFVKAGWDRTEPSPARAIMGLNAKFQELNLDERSYVTVAAVRIGRSEGRITYCAAGHNAPILMKRKDGIDEVEMNAPPVSTWIPDFTYHDSTIGYEKGISSYSSPTASPRAATRRANSFLWSASRRCSPARTMRRTSSNSSRAPLPSSAAPSTTTSPPWRSISEQKKASFAGCFFFCA